MRRSGPRGKRAQPRAEGGDAAMAAKRLAPLPGGRMVCFCPQCGQSVEAVFNFCPSCGGKLPKQEQEPMQITPSPSLKGLSQEIQDQLPRLSAKKKVDSFLPDKERASASVKQVFVQNSAATLSPKAKAKCSPRSPRKDRSASVRPLPEGQILTDLNDKQWILRKLLSQSDHGLIYEAKSASGACPAKQRYTLKLGCKDGRIFNEQNFLQRAAKKITVEKWKKRHLVPLLGIPECTGFGLHNGCYRFLVFSELGRSLQSVLDDCANKMTEKAALQLAVRLLDVLEYLHENEYTHGNIAAENIYVNPADLTAVTLANYCFAFRYSPEGKHVSQREGSRTPHEGTLEFISLDSHKGAAPSRRSDLESLGYCLMKWLCGCLPWSDQLTDPCAVMEKKERYKSDVIMHPRLSYGWRAIPVAGDFNIHAETAQLGVAHDFKAAVTTMGLSQARDLLLRQNSRWFLCKMKRFMFELLEELINWGYLLQVMHLEYDEKPNYGELRTLLRRPLQLMRTDAYDSMDLSVVP